MRGRVREFIAGVRLVREGFRAWRSSPRLMVIGLVPGIIAGLVLAVVFAGIAVWVDDWARGIAVGITADRTPNALLVGLIAIAIIGGGVLLAIYTFTAFTLLIGQPFFEAIADAVAVRIGFEYTASEEPWWRATGRGVGEGAAMLAIGGAFGLTMFLVGLVPVVGSATAFVGAAIVGGSLLSLELTAYPLSRVGVLRLRDRRRVVKGRRAMAMGFGITAYLICLVPFGAVAAMPALVAGGTMLAARLTVNPVSPPPAVGR